MGWKMSDKNDLPIVICVKISYNDHNLKFMMSAVGMWRDCIQMFVNSYPNVVC